MLVYYKGEAWYAPGIRYSFFDDYKRCNPDLQVTINRDRETKLVKISELTDG
ncbi:MAG TPA: hypothetical protein PK686_00355 [bacterium]|nr:hypothetical protein [bacterium]HPV65119.1 hypothetical protein [bacterium]